MVCGVVTHALFVITVVRLYGFLDASGEPQRSAVENLCGALTWDVALALQFALVHSALLHPVVRRRLQRWIRNEFYGLFFCGATCTGLLLTIAGWRPCGPVLWELHDVARTSMTAAFAAAWALLFYSLYLSGLGWQTGWTPWWQWVRRRPASRRTFDERSLYRWLRHPIYASFLGLIWFTPVMTLDHAVLTGVWTVYIFVGSWLKDRRLEFYLGDRYRDYEARVPGYPFLPIGPLGRKPNVSLETACDRAAGGRPVREYRKAA
jgi:protein-S-isoprenylcysteine O-methyltransferase Ste14